MKIGTFAANPDSDDAQGRRVSIVVFVAESTP